jgi:hypothetical protein
MGFHEVHVNQSIPTEASRSLISDKHIKVSLFSKYMFTLSYDC